MADDFQRLQKVAAALKEIEQRKKFGRYEFFEPYDKQKEFFALGASKRERLLRAGNQLGKSEAGAFEAAVHLTGLYPDWWKGRRWDRPTKGWASGVTGLSTRNVVQKKLFGEPGLTSMFGTGMVPKDKIVDHSMARGISDYLDTVSIKHKSGGLSIVKFLSYELGREKWQGDTIDWVWFDEEPPEDIYNEGMARLAPGGMAWMTFTPLKGKSSIVLSFLDTPTVDQGEVVMTIDDVSHFSADEKAKRVASYKPYEREARRNGIPIMGSGRVFETPEEVITEAAIENPPADWVWLWGLDFGIGSEKEHIPHAFGAVLILWDRESDTVHVRHAIKMVGSRPIDHASAIKQFGWIPVAWPQDGHQRDAGNLMPLAKLYAKEGLRMLPQHATFVDGSNSTEAGVTELDQRMSTNRFKVAAHLKDWFSEYREYHRKDGLLVKVRDDLMSATRIAIMAKRFGQRYQRTAISGKRGPNEGLAKGIDFPLF